MTSEATHGNTSKSASRTFRRRRQALHCADGQREEEEFRTLTFTSTVTDNSNCALYKYCRWHDMTSTVTRGHLCYRLSQCRMSMCYQISSYRCRVSHPIARRLLCHHSSNVYSPGIFWDRLKTLDFRTPQSERSEPVRERSAIWTCASGDSWSWDPCFFLLRFPLCIFSSRVSHFWTIPEWPIEYLSKQFSPSYFASKPLSFELNLFFHENNRFLSTLACTLRYGLDMVMFGSFLRWVLHLGHWFGQCAPRKMFTLCSCECCYSMAMPRHFYSSTR